MIASSHADDFLKIIEDELLTNEVIDSLKNYFYERKYTAANSPRTETIKINSTYQLK